MSMNMNFSRIVVVLLVTITFCLAARLVLKDWRTLGIYVPTGDEPRNLIIARSIFVDHSVEATRAVRHELQTKEFHPGYPGERTGIRQTANGMFTPHGLALPAYIALPLGYLGREGARYAMVAIAALVAGAAAWLAMFYGASPLIAFAASAGATIAMPFLPAAGQFYPDIPGGAICLLAIARLTIQRGKALTIADAAILLLVASLPWWHLRFALPAIIIIAGYLVLRQRTPRQIILVIAPLAISITALALYNLYAFGHVSGSYASERSVEVSLTSFMVLVGLLIDQNHGMFVQNPIFLVGLFFLPTFFRNNWKLATLTMLVFAALIIPTSLHINWYGGYSFSGRFQWSAATVFVIPTIFGLIQTYRRSELAFTSIVITGLWFQFFLYLTYRGIGQWIYNRYVPASIEQYTIFFGKLGKYMPAMYNPKMAYSFLPNYVFAIALILLLGLGVRYAFRPTPQQSRIRTDVLLTP